MSARSSAPSWGFLGEDRLFMRWQPGLEDIWSEVWSFKYLDVSAKISLAGFVVSVVQLILGGIATYRGDIDVPAYWFVIYAAVGLGIGIFYLMTRYFSLREKYERDVVEEGTLMQRFRKERTKIRARRMKFPHDTSYGIAYWGMHGFLDMYTQETPWLDEQDGRIELPGHTMAVEATKRFWQAWAEREVRFVPGTEFVCIYSYPSEFWLTRDGEDILAHKNLLSKSGIVVRVIFVSRHEPARLEDTHYERAMLKMSQAVTEVFYHHYDWGDRDPAHFVYQPKRGGAGDGERQAMRWELDRLGFTIERFRFAAGRGPTGEHEIEKTVETADGLFREVTPLYFDESVGELKAAEEGQIAALLRTLPRAFDDGATSGEA